MCVWFLILDPDACKSTSLYSCCCCSHWKYDHTFNRSSSSSRRTSPWHIFNGSSSSSRSGQGYYWVGMHVFRRYASRIHVSIMPISIMFIPDACFPMTLDLDAGVYDAFIFDPCPCCMLDEYVCVWCTYLWSMTLIMMDISIVLDPWPWCIYACIHYANIHDP